MRKISFLFFILSSILIHAQQTKESNFWDNVRFGGGIGLALGNSTNFAITPTAIYDFNDQFSAGISLGYQYASANDFVSNVFSTGVLSLYNPFEGVQISAEFEQLFVNQRLDDFSDSFSYPALYLGAAYRVSDYVSLGFRYDVLFNNEQSIYTSAISPIVRVFF